MLLTNHEIMRARPSGVTPNRAIAIGGVVLLHVAAIYALFTGMTAQIVKLLPRDIRVAWVDTVTPKTVPVVVQPKFVDPTKSDATEVPLPDFTISDSGKSITGTHTSVAPADSGASGLSNTHSTPPYPAEARALSHQGTVTLQLTISPEGNVVAASIAQSSGFAELDQTAVSWVIAHWKYKPAIVGGVAVTSQTQAAVKFDLKEAAR
jgi:protein TonB